MAEQYLTFEKEICDWLAQLGFAVKTFTGEDTCCKRLSVSRNKMHLLHIIIIELKHWQKNPTPERLSACFDTVGQMRVAGNKCVIIWEDYWVARKSIVQSRLNALLGNTKGIPGRLTQARRITELAASAFLDQNHLQGNVSSKFRYGLFLPQQYFRVLPNIQSNDLESTDLLVAVATFSNARTFQREAGPFRSYELIRFANRLNLRVVGGFDKLLHAFKAERAPDDIMTYADSDWSEGESYLSLGFEPKKDIPSQEFLVDIKTMQRLTRRQLEEHQEVAPVYNMGSRKFVKTFTYHEKS